jgi:hypothetical protein
VDHGELSEASGHAGGHRGRAVGEDAEEMGEKDLGRLEYLNADLMESLPLHPSMPSVIGEWQVCGFEFCRDNIRIARVEKEFGGISPTF